MVYCDLRKQVTACQRKIQFEIVTFEALDIAMQCLSFQSFVIPRKVDYPEFGPGLHERHREAVLKLELASLYQFLYSFGTIVCGTQCGNNIGNGSMVLMKGSRIIKRELN